MKKKAKTEPPTWAAIIPGPIGATDACVLILRLPSYVAASDIMLYADQKFGPFMGIKPKKRGKKIDK